MYIWAFGVRRVWGLSAGLLWCARSRPVGNLFLVCAFALGVRDLAGWVIYFWPARSRPAGSFWYRLLARIFVNKFRTEVESEALTIDSIKQLVLRYKTFLAWCARSRPMGNLIWVCEIPLGLRDRARWVIYFG